MTGRASAKWPTAVAPAGLVLDRAVDADAQRDRPARAGPGEPHCL